jgi:hypothetical protein
MGHMQMDEIREHKSDFELSFKVQGSAEEPYSVSFFYERGELTASCTCSAGIKFQPCKHWKGVLTGERQNYLGSLSDEQIELIQSSLKGTQLLLAWQELKNVERELAFLKKKLNSARSNFSRVAISGR